MRRARVPRTSKKLTELLSALATTRNASSAVNASGCDEVGPAKRVGVSPSAAEGAAPAKNNAMVEHSTSAKVAAGVLPVNDSLRMNVVMSNLPKTDGPNRLTDYVAISTACHSAFQRVRSDRPLPATTPLPAPVLRLFRDNPNHCPW